LKSKGIIYIVATPLGNLEDITARAIRILREVNFIAAEDTRHSQKLLKHLHISTPLIALHDFNERQRTANLLKKINEGASMALISDAGTPLISDPGYTLIHQAHEQGITVSPIPGPCAAIAALCASGLPTDRFVFEGFLPAKSKARQDRLQVLCKETRTLIFYEAPHRILDLVDDLVIVFGDSRLVTLAKELTKMFETIYFTNLAGLKAWLIEEPVRQKGEFVLVVQGQSESNVSLELDEDKLLAILQAELPLKQAVSLTAKILGKKRNAMYKKALGLVKK
jgi:16S rRNA (cytidine1402-2'-O)-methyltransferase